MENEGGWAGGIENRSAHEARNAHPHKRSDKLILAYKIFSSLNPKQGFLHTFRQLLFNKLRFVWWIQFHFV